MPPIRLRYLPFLVVAGFAMAGGPTVTQADRNDPPILTFAITGDTRINPDRPKLFAKGVPPDLLKEFNKPGGDKDPYPFYCNLVQVRQTLKDLALLQDPAPSYLFINGDLVMGFARDGGATLRNQLPDFTKAIQSQPTGRNLKVVLMPGNHEMTFKEYDVPTKKTTTGDDDDDQKTWRDWVKQNGYDSLGGNGPSRDALDNLGGDASRKLKDDHSGMTYSFNSPDGSVHFVVLNTDTATTELTEEGDETGGLLPLPWIKADIEKAQADGAIKHIFVVGHRPVRPPANFVKPGPDDALNAAVAEPFRKILVDNNKVRAYLASHAHLWHADTLADQGDAGTRPVQIVAGNGGVPFEDFWHPEKGKDMTWRPGLETPGPFFGFTLFKVHRSGKVTYNSWQREAPVPYYAGYADPAKAQAKPRERDQEIRK
jgi:hypothetical protein